VSQPKTIQTYESNGLDWVSFIFQLQKKENKTHSNVTMNQYFKTPSGIILVATKIVSEIVANGHTYEIYYTLDESEYIFSMCIHGLMT